MTARHEDKPTGASVSDELYTCTVHVCALRVRDITRACEKNGTDDQTRVCVCVCVCVKWMRRPVTRLNLRRGIHQSLAPTRLDAGSSSNQNAFIIYLFLNAFIRARLKA